MGYNRGSFYAIVIMIFMCFQPSKGIGYMAPYAFIVLVLVLARPAGLIPRMGMWLAVWGMLAGLYVVVDHSFEPQSFILAFITYSSFVVMFIPSSFFSPALFARVRKFLVPFVVIESGIGILQALIGHSIKGTFDKGNGDVVRGTMALGFAVDPNIANSMFIISLVFLILALYPLVAARKSGYVWLGMGILTVILASVMHVILLVAAAVVFANFCMNAHRLKTIAAMAGGLALVFGLVLTILPKNMDDIGYFEEQLMEGATPKAQLFLTSFLILPQEVPSMMFVGLGPGQFSSRAAMISTGQYLNAKGGGEQLPLLKDRIPEYTGRYEIPLWNETEAVTTNGSTQTCFASWAAVATEFGYVFLVALIGAIVTMVLRITLKVHRASNAVHIAYFRREGLVLIAAVTFLFTLGFQENYWEMPQAILVGLVLMRFMYTSLMTTIPSAVATPRPGDLWHTTAKLVTEGGGEVRANAFENRSNHRRYFEAGRVGWKLFV